MRNILICVMTLSILSILSAPLPSDALITITRDSTDIGKIVIVNPQPGDAASANGTALINALNGITDASSTNPYVLKLGPGIYNVQTTAVQMKAYVDIEGSGEKTTKITGATSSETFPPASGTVMGANNSELRFLTVENTAAGTYPAAILNLSSSPSIIHVTATASGGSDPMGICNSNSSPQLTHVTASASGGGYNFGVYNTANSSPTMTYVTAAASVASAYNYGVFNVNSSPVMRYVTASATGISGVNYGISNMFASSPVMTNVKATASEGMTNYGFWCDSISTSSSPVMTNVAASASGGTNNYGIRSVSCSHLITNTTVAASGGATANYGVYTLTSGTVKIDHSVIKGATNSINNGAGVTTLVGNTQLDVGAVSNAGTLTCIGAYSGSYVDLGADCN